MKRRVALGGGWLTALAVLLTPWGLQAQPDSGGSEAKDDEARPKAPPLAILNARVPGREGTVSIFVADGLIKNVEPRLRLPRGITRVDAQGARVVPGRIDLWGATAGADATGSALDAFDPFDTHALQDALRHGVTTVCLTPRRGSGIRGRAAAVKLLPGAPLRVVQEDVALVGGLGQSSSSPAVRAREFVAFRKLLRDAQRYRDAWLDYETELEEYVKKLAEKGEGKDAKKDDAKKAPRSRRGRRRPGPRKAPPKKDDDTKKDEKGAKKDKKKDEDEKPKEPRRDPAKDQLVRVLDGELPLWVEAVWANEILQALELQAEFDLRLLILGAEEGHLVAEALAAGEARVVLRPPLNAALTKSSYPLRAGAQNAGLLAAAGVSLGLGSGSWGASRGVELGAQLAVSAGLDPAEAEAALTARAAEWLGVGDRLGRIAPDCEADLVVMRAGAFGHEQPALVIVDGRIVHRSTP